MIVYLPIFDSLKFKVQGHSRFQGRLLEPGQHIINSAKMICKIAKEKKTNLYFLCFLALTNYFQMFSATDGYHGKGNHLTEAKLVSRTSPCRWQEIIPGQERQETPMVL